MAFDAKSNTVVDAVRALAKGVTSVGLKAIPEAWPPFWLQTQSTDLLPARFLDCTGGPAEADENPRTLLCRYGIDCYYVARWSTTAATNPYEVARNAAELLLEGIMATEHLGNAALYEQVLITSLPSFANRVETLFRDNDQPFAACMFSLEVLVLTDRPPRS